MALSTKGSLITVVGIAAGCIAAPALTQTSPQRGDTVLERFGPEYSPLGIGQGDEVILGDTNWIATAAPIVHLGATPVFVDIEPPIRHPISGEEMRFESELPKCLGHRLSESRKGRGR